MEFSVRNRKKFRTVFLVTLTGIIVAPLFTIVVFGINPVTIFKGTIIGFMITFISSIFENFIFRNKFNKLNFSSTLLIRTLFYILLISFSVMIVWVIHESSLNNTTYFETIKSNDFRIFVLQGDFKNIFLFSIGSSLLIIFFMQVSSLLGRNVLINYITGRYHKPHIEYRTFMFLDLTSSTTIAEKLGPVEYHKFINNFFFDIDSAIISCNGEIFQYVGDEVIVSWLNDNAFKNNDCVNCFFEMKKTIDLLSAKYKNQFGFVPGFKAGVHYGEVVTGEIGDSKKEIVFHGDVLNTASRIQAMSKTLNKDILISEDVKFKLQDDNSLLINSIGNFKLKGKVNEVELFSVAFIL